jgi:hypothetical protein
MRLLGLSIALLLLATAVAGAQTVYRCVRADGSVSLSEIPPARGSCVQQSRTEYGSTPAPAPPSPPAAPRAPGSPAGQIALWERREGAGPWRTLSAYDSEANCEAERDRRAQIARDRLIDAFIEEPGTVKLRAAGGAEYVSYRCSPEGTPPA